MSETVPSDVIRLNLPSRPRHRSHDASSAGRRHAERRRHRAASEKRPSQIGRDLTLHLMLKRGRALSLVRRSQPTPLRAHRRHGDHERTGSGFGRWQVHGCSYGICWKRGGPGLSVAASVQSRRGCEREPVVLGCWLVDSSNVNRAIREAIDIVEWPVAGWLRH